VYGDNIIHFFYIPSDITATGFAVVLQQALQ